MAITNTLSERIDNTYIELNDRFAYKWQRAGHLFFRGYAYHGGKLFSLEDLVELTANISTKDDISNLLYDLDGIFSLIFVTKSRNVVVCSDRVRSMPVALVKKGDTVIVKDILTRELVANEEISEDRLACFRHALFVEGDYSLFQSVYLVGAGRFAVIKDDQIDFVTYFKYGYKNEMIVESDRAVDILYESYAQMMERAIKVLKGRKVVIPLSGGHDSRLLLHLLAEQGYKNIATYSYGIKNNSESVISKRVSDYYGVDSYFIEYKNKELRDLFNKYIYDYSLFASNGTSVPCLQEWYAVYRLKKQGVIDKNSVIMPGYSGDFFAGTHLSRDARTKQVWAFEELIRHIRLRYYREFDERYQYSEELISQLIKKTVLCHTERKESYDSRGLNEIVERYDWYNRQSKYIVNAVRTYDFWGIKWMIPFFEKGQFDVWAGIDNELRYNREVFFSMEKKYYSRSFLDIPFYNGQNDGRIKSLFNILIKGLPYIHYMYGYYGVSFPEGIVDWLNGRLRGVDVYSKDTMLDVFISARGNNPTSSC